MSCRRRLWHYLINRSDSKRHLWSFQACSLNTSESSQVQIISAKNSFRLNGPLFKKGFPYPRASTCGSWGQSACWSRDHREDIVAARLHCWEVMMMVVVVIMIVMVIYIFRWSVCLSVCNVFAYICHSMPARDQGQRVKTCCAERRKINIGSKASLFA